MIASDLRSWAVFLALLLSLDLSKSIHTLKGLYLAYSMFLLLTKVEIEITLALLTYPSLQCKILIFLLLLTIYIKHF